MDEADNLRRQAKRALRLAEALSDQYSDSGVEDTCRDTLGASGESRTKSAARATDSAPDEE